MPDLADIFRLHGPEYLDKYSRSMLPSHWRVIWDVTRCRTEDLGGQVWFCKKCNEHRFSYHSCKNRSCPKCQNDQATEWLEEQQQMLLPVPYFMITFTLPEELRETTRSNQKIMYNLLFRASAEALKKLAADPKYVGGMLGMIGVLQTWARDLGYHPHIHYLIPAGGLDEKQKTWSPARDNYLLPEPALAIIFRAKFRDALKKAGLFEKIPKKAWKKKWVVDIEAVGDGKAALKYLAPYVFRTAISNRNILALRNGEVTFRYHDSETKQTKILTLTAEMFIRRFLQHVLPRGFIKVRYYGFFSPKKKKELEIVKELLHVNVCKKKKKTRKSTEFTCPKCGGKMTFVEVLRPKRGPPIRRYFGKTLKKSAAGA